ncbi:hypothetical protein ACFWIO_12320 [Streptomyces diastatochromogenes]|uniref:hypothetical protein n=1 Tax=Streptomyces diastatochromogenes TaxID=42236 RepID=UPI00364D307B
MTTAAALVAAGLTAMTATGTAEAATARQVEKLDRGVVSVHTDRATWSAGSSVGVLP